jgi:glycosyltransferase involved in cell wall biosynthesis
VSVTPSTVEAFGLGIAESLAAGVPVIGVNATAVPELLQDGGNGVLVNRDFACRQEVVQRVPNVMELAESVNRFLCDHEWRDLLASRARGSVMGLTWKALAAAVVKTE